MRPKTYLFVFILRTSQGVVIGCCDLRTLCQGNNREPTFLLAGLTSKARVILHTPSKCGDRQRSHWQIPIVLCASANRSDAILVTS